MQFSVVRWKVQKITLKLWRKLCENKIRSFSTFSIFQSFLSDFGWVFLSNFSTDLIWIHNKEKLCQGLTTPSMKSTLNALIMAQKIKSLLETFLRGKLGLLSDLSTYVPFIKKAQSYCAVISQAITLIIYVQFKKCYF